MFSELSRDIDVTTIVPILARGCVLSGGAAARLPIVVVARANSKRLSYSRSDNLLHVLLIR
jgi:hypothetical protein